jgi:hypothetical protein
VDSYRRVCSEKTKQDEEGIFFKEKICNKTKKV